ncbi:Ribonuclease [Forsythia ovata]|uniref:Ribonuclease n=1 Tax=Forsythia ovata TaxID=205694 RepID=A0ABD1S1H3_9LAMI
MEYSSACIGDDKVWGVVEDVSLPHLASLTAFGSRPTVLQEPETVVGNPHIPPAPEVAADIPSPSNPARPVPPPENVRQSVKRKPEAENGEQASRTSMSPPPGRYEYINIGAHQDKLDPSVLGKLPPAVALAAASVHKYWTSSFGKAADTAEVTELIKLAEMYTSRSHVLNCELYKMLEMKVDEIHSVIGEDEDVEAMRAEIKRFRARLAFFEDARTRATYNVMKAQTIQKVCVAAQKKAESQLKSCQSMIQAKDKELTEVLNELTKAKGLLAKLGVSEKTATLLPICRLEMKSSEELLENKLGKRMLQKGLLLEFKKDPERVLLAVAQKPDGKKNWMVFDQNGAMTSIKPQQIIFNVPGVENFDHTEISDFVHRAQNPTLFEFAWIELLKKNKSVRVEELAEVDELLRRKHAKEAAENELKEFVMLLKSAREMPSYSKPAKSSWRTEEKIRHRIESLEAYAIDKHYILPYFLM